MKRFVLGMFFLRFSITLFSQPFIDPVNFNQQNFQSPYSDSLHSTNWTTDNNLNIFFPKQFDNGNTFLFRLNSEYLRSIRETTNSTTQSDLYAFSMPVGFQFLSKNKKWKSLFMFIPKIASDLKDNLSKDIQYGGTGLFTYVFNDSLKIKFGLFYNRECFGNLFVPLMGIDWHASARWSVYGVLPNNMKVEFKCGNNFYLGLSFKNFKRSYRLSQNFNDDLILVKETSLKLFADQYLMNRKIVIFVEAGYTLKYSLLEYKNGSKEDLGLNNQTYSPMKNDFVTVIGLAYRIRTD